MCACKGFADFLNLTRRLRRSKVDSCANGNSTQIPGLLNRAIHDLIVCFRVAKKLIVVELNDEWNFVCVLARHHAKDAKCRCDRIAAAGDSQIDNVFRIEIDRIRREGSGGGVLNALVNWQDRKVSRVCQTPCAIELLKATQNLRGSVTLRKDTVHPVWPWQMKLTLIDFGFVAEQAISLLPKPVGD